MSQRHPSILSRLSTALGLAVLAALAFAVPAIAESSATYGNLTFSSDGELSGVMSDAEGEVTVSGAADITVTPAATPDGVDITSIVIGGEGDDAYSGSITFQGVTLNPVAIQIASANAAFADCALTGGADAPTITATGGCAIAFSGTTTLTGGAGASGASPTDGTAALRATGETSIDVSGTMTVNGGAGGNLDGEQGTPTAGGAGIYAPSATLSMTSGSLTVKAGDTYTATAAATPSVLPVGLTVGKLQLSNGTGTAGEGPEVTAVGWPTANSTPLPVDGLDAGSLDDDTFYPWVLQASQSLDGSEPLLMDFAGSGETGPIQREGWRWFNIAPHEATGLEVVAIDNADDAASSILNVTNPISGSEDMASYTLGVTPVFGDLGEMGIYGWDGAAVSNPSATPEGAVRWLGMGDAFVVSPSFTGDSITISGTATLPDAFTALYPDLPTNVSTAFGVENVKAVYRLYNQYNGDHLFSTVPAEVEGTEALGWTFEHVVWLEPAVAGEGDATVLRFFNPYTSDHYYVLATDTEQIDGLMHDGWKEDSEESSLISLPASEGYPVYTLFNPYVQTGTHLYTTSYDEVQFLTHLGWEENTTIIYSLPITVVHDEV